jgi:hypothetical protein
MKETFYIVPYIINAGYICFDLFSTHEKAEEFLDWSNQNDAEITFMRGGVQAIELSVANGAIHCEGLDRKYK